MRKYLIGFLLGFLVGPIIVIGGFGSYTTYRIHKMDTAQAEKTAEIQAMQSTMKPPARVDTQQEIKKYLDQNKH